MLKIGLLGIGKLGECIASALSTDPNVELRIFEKDDKRRESLSQNPDFEFMDSASELAGLSDLVILAVRPGDAGQAIEDMGKELETVNALVSVCAGLKLEKLKGLLASELKLMRLMVNVAIFNQNASMALCGDENVAEEDFLRVEELFSPLGKVHRLEEQYFDAFTALCASGPAFVFSFIKGLSRGAQKFGMSAELSETLAVEMSSGALSLLEKTSLDAEQWIKKVATPGGCTEEGLKQLSGSGFEDILTNCIEKTTEKSSQLGD